MVDRCEALEAQLEQHRWRKVADELPESETGYVIGWFPEWPGGMLCSLTVTPKDDMWQYATHWMPLPAPPEQEVSE